MSSATIVALVAGVFSLTTSLVTLALQQRYRRRAERHEAELLRLRAEVEEGGRERDAQRDYEYDARKRLYSEVQPLFFQLGEAAGASFDCIRHLQGFRAFRLMEEVDSSLTINATYRLLAPLAIVRLIQRRLTAVDLRLDPALRAQYLVAREMLYTFTQGEEIARLAPALAYTWTGDDRQHLLPARQEVVVGRLMVAEGDAARCVSYPEFEARYLQDGGLREATLPVREWLCGANPRTKPVLWRSLVIQGYLACALKDMIDNGRGRPASLTPPAAEHIFNWRTKQPIAPEMEAVAARGAAETLLRKRLGASLPG